MLRFFDFQVNLSTDQGRIKEIEVTARMTSSPEVILRSACKVSFSVTCPVERVHTGKLPRTPYFRHYDIDLGSSCGRITSVLPTILKLSVRY
jgi:hypothetical protein